MTGEIALEEKELALEYAATKAISKSLHHFEYDAEATTCGLKSLGACMFSGANLNVRPQPFATEHKQ